MNDGKRIGVIGFVLSGIALIASVYAISQLTLEGNRIFNEFSEVGEKLDTVNSKLAALDAQIEKSENLKVELIALETRMKVQFEQLDEVAGSAQATAIDTKKQLSGLSSEVTELSKKIPEGISLPEISCVPLGKRVRLAQHKGVEFCDSELIVSVGEIRPEDNVVNLGHLLAGVPMRTNQGFGNCTVNLMAINRDDIENPTVDLVGVCNEKP